MRFWSASALSVFRGDPSVPYPALSGPDSYSYLHGCLMAISKEVSKLATGPPIPGGTCTF